jgi:hypothetical protein
MFRVYLRLIKDLLLLPYVIERAKAIYKAIITVTALPVRLLFLIRTSRDHMTRPLDASTLDILDLLLLGSSSFLSFVSSNKRQLTRLLVPDYVLVTAIKEV